MRISAPRIQSTALPEPRTTARRAFLSDPTGSWISIAALGPLRANASLVATGGPPSCERGDLQRRKPLDHVSGAPRAAERLLHQKLAH